ncbi:hypothetical protein [Streptomyces sp. DT203]|uniref:hypothetical protein n=1 Tax=Streptomyces sp. DT203 TaxID=3393424 RepID=UPI003CE67A64
MAARDIGLPCQLPEAVAAVTTKPLHEPLQEKPLPAGRPREWYISHNRRLKAMRLAIALLDTGVYSADNAKMRMTAERIGIHPPSDTTCRMVRALISYGR